MQVFVGIPESKSGRAGTGVTNAQLAFLHTHGVRAIEMRTQVSAMESNHSSTFSAATQMWLQRHGSPLWQIPPRPIIEPAIEDPQNRNQIAAQLEAAMQSALGGNLTEAKQKLRSAGMVAANLVKGWFTNPRNGWAPNAPGTISHKGSDRPLIDSAQLRNSITSVVDEG